jgi:hypothetical protein
MKQLISQAREHVILGQSPQKSVGAHIAHAITSMKSQNAFMDDDPSFFDQEVDKDNTSRGSAAIQSDKENEDDTKMQQAQKENRLLEFMQESQLYYEKNLIAFDNNMSLLALNTYEISQMMSNLNRDN